MLKKPSQSPSEFGRLIRQKRRAQDIGIVEFAESCGLDPAQLSRVEHGLRRPPDVPCLMLMATALGIPLQSGEYFELLNLAMKERDPELYKLVNRIANPTLWDFLRGVRGSAGVTMCASPSELVSKAAEAAISGEAVEIRVKPKRGAVKIFRLKT